MINLRNLGNSIEMTIQDNGIGLPDDLDWNNTDSLGLSLVYDLVTEQLEGTITVERNHGTVFKIEFPAVNVCSSKFQMDQVRILVVEDEVIVARTIASQLNQLGYIVTGTASSGKVAIAKASETKPELVLMDIILKGEMDGITTAAYIREQLDIPVIFLTAYGDENTLQRAKITQPFGYVVKPFTSQDLRIAIEIGLLKHQLERDLRENRDR